MAIVSSLLSLENHPITTSGLYIHIPFCSVKCRFCDFAAFPGRRADIGRYLTALAREMKTRPSAAVDTIYVGGGTPSLLDPTAWRNLMTGVDACYGRAPQMEMSVECNPETVTTDRLAAWKETGVNRLSLGLQTDEPGLLALLGRSHDWGRFVEAFEMSRQAGFENMNVDLMFGLPGQTLDGWEKSLSRVSSLSPDHISVYALHVEDRTWFHRSGVREDNDLQAAMYERAAEFLTGDGYRHYEISNYSRPGRECRHNLKYWRNEPCAGVGVSAAGFDGEGRSTNLEDFDDYLRAVEAGRSPVAERTVLDADRREGERLLLGLRLAEGVTPTQRGFVLYGKVLERFVDQGLLFRDGPFFRPTRRGWMLSNRMFVEFV